MKINRINIPAVNPYKANQLKAEQAEQQSQDENRQTRNFIRSQTTFGKVFIHSRTKRTCPTIESASRIRNLQSGCRTTRCQFSQIL